MAEDIDEIVVQGRDINFNINQMMSLGGKFLKSNRFALKLYNLPTFVNYLSSDDFKNITFLCDSLEFPGQALTATERRYPGEFRKRIPYLRDANEVTLSFYFSEDIPIYQMFSGWIYGTSPTATTNEYYDNIVCDLHLAQFSEIDSLLNIGFGGVKDLIRTQSEVMRVSLKNAYPINMASLPSNWADDGFHKISVTFAYETLDLKGLNVADLLEEVEITQRIANLPAELQNTVKQQNSKPGIFSFLSGIFGGSKKINNKKTSSINPYSNDPINEPVPFND
jgi:hypothetical protein